MAISITTLSAAVTATDLVWPVTSATGFATSTTAPQWVRCDNEFAVISPAFNLAPFSGTKNIPVYRRGDNGGAVVAHNALATVETGLFSDLPTLQPGSVATVVVPTEIEDAVTYSVNGAIALPSKNTTVYLAKAGVAAMTLALPTGAMDGITISIIGLTAQANTVTLPSAAFLDGLTGGPHTVWTATTGFKGQGLTIQAIAGQWAVLANNQGTFS